MVITTPYESGRDFLSPNRNLSPLSTEVDANKRLMVGGCLLSDLAQRYGTPLYVIDEITIRTACRSYRDALVSHYSGSSLPIYASKANSSIALSRIIASEGLGMDVVSAGELLTALEGGVLGEKIFLHGNNKSEEEISLAYRNRVNIVIDNRYDLERIEKIVPSGADPASIMLRFTPGIECHTHEYIRTGHLDSKFGFDLDQVKSIFKELQGVSWARLTGIHAHIGSQIFELKPHQDLAEVMADVLLMGRNFGHPIEDFNVGGGLGVRYIESDDPPSIQKWVQVVSEAVIVSISKRKLNLPRLICEPGRSLVATSGITLYELGSRKSIPGIRKYLSVDGGMSDNPRPITYQSSYSACLADYPLEVPDEIVTIAGKHCESGDVLLKDVSLPKSKSGDVLVVFCTGAYNSSMSSNYNRIPKPAAIILLSGQADLLQRREQPEDLLRYDVIPERLRELG